MKYVIKPLEKIMARRVCVSFVSHLKDVMGILWNKMCLEWGDIRRNAKRAVLEKIDIEIDILNGIVPRYILRGSPEKKYANEGLKNSSYGSVHCTL